MKTKTESIATPRPWFINGRSRNGYIRIDGSDEGKVGVDFLANPASLTTTEENALLIVKSVNGYEGLLEQHHRDSQTLAEYAKEKNDLRQQVKRDRQTIGALLEAANRIISQDGKDRPIGSETLADRQALVKAINQAEGGKPQ